MKSLGYVLGLIVLVSMLIVRCNINSDNRTALEIGVAVADKIVRESQFELKSVPQKSVQGIQVLDYTNEFPISEDIVFYSYTNIMSKSDTSLVLGVSFSGELNVYVNNDLILTKKNSKPADFKEIAYSLFKFQESFTITLKEGKNGILLKLKKLNSDPIVIIREIPREIENRLSGNFELNEFGYYRVDNDWLSISSKKEISRLTEDYIKGELKDVYSSGDRNVEWQPLVKNELQELVIPETNSYKRESYLEWHYANGTVLFGMQSISSIINDVKYSKFVEDAVLYTLKNYDLFKSQFHDDHAFRGSNNRMFRKSMLDDTGAPALPYLNYYLKSKDEGVKFIIDDMNEYVVNKQVRLEDDTFCRPEPTEMTVWADDLFMSVPFLVRMGKLTGDQNYFDDCANQIINFNKYLFDEEMGLYKHGWFGKTASKSIAFWGRANGWIAWATSEALLHMPKDHKQFEKIKSIFKSHLRGLIKYQSKNGMWHQILNYPNSFKETSCTSMYIIGILRGVENGWLEETYTENALLAWNELKTKINKDGTVKDICRGTGIGYDLEFYYNRNRFDNDPRGLGAVLTAAMEVHKTGN